MSTEGLASTQEVLSGEETTLPCRASSGAMSPAGRRGAPFTSRPPPYQQWSHYSVHSSSSLAVKTFHWPSIPRRILCPQLIVTAIYHGEHRTSSSNCFNQIIYEISMQFLWSYKWSYKHQSCKKTEWIFLIGQRHQWYSKLCYTYNGLSVGKGVHLSSDEML